MCLGRLQTYKIKINGAVYNAQGWNFKPAKPIYPAPTQPTNFVPASKQPTGCVCDIQVLLAGGCQCGYIEIERRSKNEQPTNM